MVTCPAYSEEPALAEPRVKASETIETLQYTTSAEANPLRAVLELQTVFLTGFVYYLTTSNVSSNWDLNYEWDILRRKITGEAFGPDRNEFGTNFIGHPLGGTGYYLAARSNRLGIYESLAISIAGSLVWEYFGEVREVISLNDTVITPLAGIAIGESMFQLGSFFDRSGPETSNKVLGAVFGPLKTLNDWFDDLHPVRTSSGFPSNEWHRFELELGAGVVTEGARPGYRGSESFQSHFALRERLARLPDFAGAGQHRLKFSDAKVSGMRLEGAVGSTGVTDLNFTTQVVLAGYYYRDARTVARQLWGGGGVVGLASGFNYSFHDYERLHRGAVDRISTVRPLAALSENVVHLGGLRLHARAEAGPSFGGVQALAIDGYRGPQELLPEVTRINAYYFGLGGYGEAAISLNWRSLQLDAELRAEAYGAVGGPHEGIRVPMSDTRGLFDASLGYNLPDNDVLVRARLGRRVRGSRVADAHLYRSETSFGLSTAMLF